MTEDVVCLLRALVRAESENPPGDTTGPARVAAGALSGLPVEVLARDGRKPNVVVDLRRGDGPHVHLNAHLDTIPPGDASAWTVPPLELTERDGRLLGLGTGNMKGAVAAMILAVRRLDARPWGGRLTLSLVADECVFGPEGAAWLLDARPDLVGEALICGEGPGGMGLAVAEKGLMWVRLTARGRVGQGMLTGRGASAPARLAAALLAVDGWNEVRAAPPLASLDHEGNREGMRVSANVGRLEGGAGFSQAVSEASAQVDLRLPPGMTRADMALRLDGLGVGWEEVKGWEPNWSDPASPPAVALREAAREVRGEAPRDVTRLPASDAARWRLRGVPAVCYGPQPDLASGPDDHVLGRDLLDCVEVYEGAALRLLHHATPAQV